jgi:iron only hydrogenase large subunit-like protein
MPDKTVIHSVVLDKDRCKGCTTCIKHCPTEAIRVRRGRAHIISQRCIDCGICIRVCPQKAKKAECDPLDKIKEYKYTVALPAPSLYGQFRNLTDINVVLNGLIKIGFDKVWEVSRGAEIISAATNKALETEELPKPVISAACPAVVRLICIRFPGLIPNIIDLIAPFEVAAIQARDEAVRETGLRAEEIGVFFITPCPAKVTAAKNPGNFDKPVINGCISMSEIYKRLLVVMKESENQAQLSRSGLLGIGWAKSGGETAALTQDVRLNVDGIENVISVLESIEDGSLQGIDFVELNACNLGCIGGCLTVENPYIAREHLIKLAENKSLPLMMTKPEDRVQDYLRSKRNLVYEPIFEIVGDREEAMEKYQRIEKLTRELPGLDCGSCGAPSCRALAEDIVLGSASEDDCIFRFREKMQKLNGEGNADAFLAPPFRRGDNDNDG